MRVKIVKAKGKRRYNILTTGNGSIVRVAKRSITKNEVLKWLNRKSALRRTRITKEWMHQVDYDDEANQIRGFRIMI